MGVSQDGGIPIAGWFFSGKTPSFEMDDDLGVPPFQETSNFLYVQPLLGVCPTPSTTSARLHQLLGPETQG